jgi:hypothetical protein
MLSDMMPGKEKVKTAKEPSRNNLCDLCVLCG